MVKHDAPPAISPHPPQAESHPLPHPPVPPPKSAASLAQESSTFREENAAAQRVVSSAHRLLSETGHDLQSPLMAVRESVRMVRDGYLGPLNDEQREALGGAAGPLLIDGDMRRPSLARSFELPRDTGGLAAIVAGEAEVRDCIHSVHGIDVLPAGRVPPNPLELLSSQRFKRLIKGLSEHYDRIIIDSAPCQAVSDAMVLASMADGLVFVIKSDATPFPVVQNSIKRLRGVNATILGGVLNRVDVEKKARYGYGGYSGYYDAYTYGTYGHYSSDKS
jgi:capsular exopolysaccharide synthesis family protein